MVKPVEVKVGDRFNRWEVLSEVFYKNFPSGAKVKFVKCRCDCGSLSELRLGTLTSPTKPSQSCGCLRLESMELLRDFPKVGSVFGRLEVISEGYREDKRSYTIVKCSCGSEPFRVRIDMLKGDNTNSCGCLQKQIVSELSKTHGMTGTSAYRSWQGMKDRCTNPNNSRWDRYGGRGICYPSNWETFEGFWNDMSEGWYEGADIDRIDFDANYYKENCRWVDRDVGNHNKSKSGCTSAYKGVYYDKARDAWVARLNRNSIIYLQKRFNTELAAAKAYDDMSEQIYGDRPNGTT
jgi:hypothetical protein